LNHHSINEDGGQEVLLHVILPSALRGGEWPVTRDGRFTPGEDPIDSGCPAKYVTNIQAMLCVDNRVSFLSLSFLYF